jgi:hypothetical protein
LNFYIFIEIQKAYLVLNLSIFDSKNYYFSFYFLKLKFKKIFDLKLEIWIPNYYSGFLELIFQFRKLLIESKNGHFNFEFEN